MGIHSRETSASSYFVSLFEVEMSLSVCSAEAKDRKASQSLQRAE